MMIMLFVIVIIVARGAAGRPTASVNSMLNLSEPAHHADLTLNRNLHPKSHGTTKDLHPNQQYQFTGAKHGKNVSARHSNSHQTRNRDPDPRHTRQPQLFAPEAGAYTNPNTNPYTNPNTNPYTNPCTNPHSNFYTNPRLTSDSHPNNHHNNFNHHNKHIFNADPNIQSHLNIPEQNQQHAQTRPHAPAITRDQHYRPKPLQYNQPLTLAPSYSNKYSHHPDTKTYFLPHHTDPNSNPNTNPNSNHQSTPHLDPYSSEDVLRPNHYPLTTADTGPLHLEELNSKPNATPNTNPNTNPNIGLTS